MAEGTGLENRRRETVREFESLLLRHQIQRVSESWPVLLCVLCRCLLVKPVAVILLLPVCGVFLLCISTLSVQLKKNRIKAHKFNRIAKKVLGSRRLSPYTARHQLHSSAGDKVRRGGRVAEGTGLENRRRETVREFESLLLRHQIQRVGNCRPVLLSAMRWLCFNGRTARLGKTSLFFSIS